MSTSRRFSPELLQKIKAGLNLVEIVGEHVVLRKSGANFVGLCPFHSERTPSFSVSESKQLYHCYGCRKGGDLLSFIMEIHGMDFVEAIEELSERARIPLPSDLRSGIGGINEDPEVQRRKEEARKKLETSYRLNRFAAAYFHQALNQLPLAARYFQTRGLGGANEELLRTFYLGASAPSWDSLAVYLTAKKAPLPLAVELGLLRPSTRGSAQASGTGYFDLFRNRAIFPILDLRGRVAGFGGRALPGGDENPKYLNSPDSSLFQKSKLAFGLYQAQKHIREKDEVILVEGYFDVLALHAAGFQNTVASCGTALSSEHLILFRKFASRVTVLFDGDKAGIAATERAMETGLAHGMVLHGAAMPKDQDPDEMLFDQTTGLPLESGREKMEAVLRGAQPLLDVRIEEAFQSAQEGSEARTQALKKMGSWLTKFTDSVGREVRLQHIQNKMGVSRQLLFHTMDPSGEGEKAKVGDPRSFLPAQKPRKLISPQANRTHAPQGLSRVEKVLLAGLAQGEKSAQLFLDSGAKLPPTLSPAELFDYPPARNFVLELLSDVDRFSLFCKNPGAFVTGDLDTQVRLTLTEVAVGGSESHQEETFQGALDKGIARLWARFSQRIKAALGDAEAKKDAGLQSQLMKEYLDVQRKMKEFISFYDEA